MKTIKVQWVIRRALCLVCVPLLAGGLMVAQQPAPPKQAPAQLLSPDQLDTLVAPFALYPDALLSQVLVAATYPLEIVEAGQWLQQNRNLQGPQLVDAARQQNWDASVQALVAFPDVVVTMNQDVQWTTALGNAFLAQQSDVMAAVQKMRARAQANGRLSSTAQQTVTTETQGGQAAIDIAPADPQVIYVPEYDPAYVWGPPARGYYPPLYYYYGGYGFGFYPGINIVTCFGGWGGRGRGGRGLGPELVWRLGVRQWRLLQPLWLPRWAIRGRVCRQSGVAARRGPPFRSLVPERSTHGTVWGRIARFAERDDKIEQPEFHPIGRHGKLEPVWIGDGVNVREPIGDAGCSQHGTAERRSRNRGAVATLPGCATQPGSGAAVFGSGAAVFGSGAAILGSGAAILGSGAAILGSGAAIPICAANVRTELQRGRA